MHLWDPYSMCAMNSAPPAADLIYLVRVSYLCWYGGSWETLPYLTRFHS